MAGISLKYVNTYDPNDRLRRQVPELIMYKAMTKQDVLTENEVYIIDNTTVSKMFAEYNLRRQDNPHMKEYKTEEDFINHTVKALKLSGYFTEATTMQNNNSNQKTINKKEEDKGE
jgi:hypothetical protein